MVLIRLYTLTGALVIAAATSTLLMMRRKKKTPEQRETLRRERISSIGRITDGTLLDVHEYDPNTEHAVRMVIYSYEVAGAQYECSQDVTNLQQSFDVHAYRIGVAASVKYDPKNPGNSIVISESWCGLRT
jgi:hypothetical protein